MGEEVDPKLQEMFDAVDKNKSGRISATELQTILKSNGDRVTLEACYLLIGLFDNGIGSIDIFGFAKLLVLFVSWSAVFKRFDPNESGFVDKGELAVALQELYPQKEFDEATLETLQRKFGDPFKEGLSDDQFLYVCAYMEKNMT